MRDQAELASDGRRWFGLAVEMQRQAKAEEILKDRDYEIFGPVLVERFGHPRRGTKDFERPLYPGYLFLHALPHRTHWHELLEVPFVIGLICQGERPLPARMGAIEQLQRMMLDGDGTIWRDEKGDLQPGPIPSRRSQRRLPQYQVGCMLRITGGPFQAFEGQYLGPDGDDLKLAVDIFGRTTVSVFPSTLVRPA